MIAPSTLARPAAIVALLAVFAAALRPALVVSATAGPVETVAPAERRPALAAEGFRLAGSFVEPLGRVNGYVVAAPSCRDEAGVLAVPAAFSAIGPAELRWTADESAYRIGYLYGGTLHEGATAGTAITARNIAWRLAAAFHLADSGDAMRFYHKVWWPKECAMPSVAELTRLARGLSG